MGEQNFACPADNPNVIRLDISISEEDARILDDYCKQTGKARPDAIRDGIRLLGREEESKMPPRKVGRPTDNPKDISLKIRLDKGTDEKLEACIHAMNLSKAEVIRLGIHRIYEDLNKQ